MLDVSVPAGHVHCLSAPVTVASVVHVLPSTLFCKSAMLCVAPVGDGCPHAKIKSFVASTMTSFGLTGHAVGGESSTSSVIQSDVSVCPAFVLAATRQSMLLPLIVPPGTVTFGVSPAHVLTLIFVVAVWPCLRSCNVNELTAKGAREGLSAACSNPKAKTLSTDRSIYPEDGAKLVSAPLASSADVVTMI